MAEYKKNLEELNDIGTKTIETNRLLRKFQISDAEQMFHGMDDVFLYHYTKA